MNHNIITCQINAQESFPTVSEMQTCPRWFIRPLVFFFKDDEYQTSYDDHGDDHGVHQQENPEDDVAGEEQQGEEEQRPAEVSQVFDTEEVSQHVVFVAVLW